MLFLGIQISPNHRPNPAIKSRPVADRTGPRVVPTIAPIADHTTTIEIIRPRCSLFSPSIAYSVTESTSGGAFTVPSRLILLGSSPRENISAISPIATSTSFDSPTGSSASSSGSSSKESVPIKKLPKSTPAAFWNLRLERISSSGSFSILTQPAGHCFQYLPCRTHN